MSVLKMAFHGDSGRRMVEVFDSRGKFVAAIYPGGPTDDTIKIITKYQHAVKIEESADTPTPLTDINITFLSNP